MEEGLKNSLDKWIEVYNNGRMEDLLSDAKRLREQDGFGTEILPWCVGVFALVDKGVVVYVCGSKNLWGRLGELFRTKRRGRANGDTKLGYRWTDAKEFSFDEVLIRYCYLDELERMEHDLVEKYQPEHNISLRPTKVRLGVDELFALAGIALERRQPKPIRRLRL
jgi:hypothetical protein